MQKLNFENTDGDHQGIISVDPFDGIQNWITHYHQGLDMNMLTSWDGNLTIHPVERKKLS